MNNILTEHRSPLHSLLVGLTCLDLAVLMLAFPLRILPAADRAFDAIDLTSVPVLGTLVDERVLLSVLWPLECATVLAIVWLTVCIC
jgi:hypothetical protein